VLAIGGALAAVPPACPINRTAPGGRSADGCRWWAGRSPAMTCRFISRAVGNGDRLQHRSSCASQIQGQIVSINFTEGQSVHTGDLLAVHRSAGPYQASTRAG